MHIATQYDMSVQVPATAKLTNNPTIRNILGVDDINERILNWDITKDKKIL